ncbi:hypothetical protein PYW07_002312 [Mythimna separata]|uniref:RING-type domain-containing protein n=1 Tax=Mythimna separata TaxID=271217 RepID=A0AAD8DSZ0_MYTSE|nr:hypothetical protein PYW07_002312 [Mythimna separata]
MISLVAKIINIFATSLQTVLLLASFTGKFIVSTVTWILSIVISTLKSILFFFQIVYEDNVSIFTEEIPASANGILDAFIYQVHYLQDGVINICNEMYSKLSGLVATANWLTQAVIVMLSEVLTLVKSSVIFVGDTVWLIVTFVPIHLPQLLRAVFKYIGHVIGSLIVDAYMTLLKFTNYLTEVPLQSFMGITSAIIIVRLCVHFRETIVIQMNMLYWSLIRNVLYLYYALLNYFTNSEVGLITQMAGGQDIDSRDVTIGSSPIDDAANAADSLCVICQERQKCVLTLPCRHVCLCTDCCRRLYGYQRTCPICRTFIYHTVTVYL